MLGRRRLVAALAMAGAVALTAGACGGGSSGGTSNAKAVNGGTATFAFDAGGGANYIFPLQTGEFATTANSGYFNQLMWRNLYWYGQDGGSNVDYSLSLAKAPTFSADGKTVTIDLNNYKWSDGTPVTTRDIVFWDNLVKANKNDWFAYSPGDFPDNLTKTTVVSPTEMKLTFDKAYNQEWLLYNQLSLITPLPQQAWDKTSATGKAGNFDESSSGAKAVYKFLDGQSKKLSTFASNPLWKTVDGPWTLKSFDTNGNLTMVPNKLYSGPIKPHLAQFKEQSFTDTSAEFNALESGNGPDYGFISNIQLPKQNVLGRLGYTKVPEYDFVTDYNLINFNNPTMGPVFKQLYIRQVIQELQNQDGIDQTYYTGTAYPSCGPVPPLPKNSFVDAYAASCPYKYDPTKAAATLKAHGWSVIKGGVDTCIKPGTAANECGAGIPAGRKLEMSYIYATGGIVFPKTIEQEASDASQVGVKFDLKPLPYNEAGAQTVLCKPSQPVCKWGLSSYGWIYAPDYYPSGEALFQTGAGNNLGGYSDPHTDSLIRATTLKTNESPQQAMNAYQDYLTNQIPVIWQPNTFAINEIRTKLHGAAPANIFGSLTPEAWYYTK